MSLQQAEWAYDWCEELVSRAIPYVLSGGHGVGPAEGPLGRELAPTKGTIDPENVPVPGYDCSGAASAVLWRTGVLGHQVALNTEEFESWGEAGVGGHITLRVLDTPVIHHCFLVFTAIPGKPNRMFAAQIPGTKVGWFTAEESWVDAFHARHI